MTANQDLKIKKTPSQVYCYSSAINHSDGGYLWMWGRIKTASTLTRISESDIRVGLTEAVGAQVMASVNKSHLRCEFGVLAEHLRVCVCVL